MALCLNNMGNCNEMQGKFLETIECKNLAKWLSESANFFDELKLFFEYELNFTKNKVFFLLLIYSMRIIILKVMI